MVQKIKTWIEENIPTLTVLYENKYIGMAYDRFGSLTAKQQKNVLMGGTLLLLAIFLGFLGSIYSNFSTYKSLGKNTDLMHQMLLNYQKRRNSRAGKVAFLERNRQLDRKDALSKHLIRQGSASSISPRMTKVKEQEGPAAASDAQTQEVRTKQAVVTLEKVNLTQLKSFLQNIEYGRYNLSISSLKVKNDSKVRGYMNVEMAVVAYLFQSSLEN